MSLSPLFLAIGVDAELEEEAARAWEAAALCAGRDAEAEETVFLMLEPELGWAGQALIGEWGLHTIVLLEPNGPIDVIYHEVAHAWVYRGPSGLVEGRAQLLSECMLAKAGHELPEPPTFMPTAGLPSAVPLEEWSNSERVSEDRTWQMYSASYLLALAMESEFGLEATVNASLPSWKAYRELVVARGAPELANLGAEPPGEALRPWMALSTWKIPEGAWRFPAMGQWACAPWILGESTALMALHPSGDTAEVRSDRVGSVFLPWSPWGEPDVVLRPDGPFTLVPEGSCLEDARSVVTSAPSFQDLVRPVHEALALRLRLRRALVSLGARETTISYDSSFVSIGAAAIERMGRENLDWIVDYVALLDASPAVRGLRSEDWNHDGIPDVVTPNLPGHRVALVADDRWHCTGVEFDPEAVEGWRAPAVGLLGDGLAVRVSPGGPSSLRLVGEVSPSARCLEEGGRLVLAGRPEYAALLPEVLAGLKPGQTLVLGSSASVAAGSHMAVADAVVQQGAAAVLAVVWDLADGR